MCRHVSCYSDVQFGSAGWHTDGLVSSSSALCDEDGRSGQSEIQWRSKSGTAEGMMYRGQMADLTKARYSGGAKVARRRVECIGYRGQMADLDKAR